MKSEIILLTFGHVVEPSEARFIQATTQSTNFISRIVIRSKNWPSIERLLAFLFFPRTLHFVFFQIENQSCLPFLLSFLFLPIFGFCYRPSKYFSNIAILKYVFKTFICLIMIEQYSVRIHEPMVGSDITVYLPK